MPPTNGFYTQVSYKGAFKDINWASGWTALSEYGLLTALGGGEPPVYAVPPVPTSPVLSVVLNGSSVEISFASKTGVTYQLRSRPSLASGTWSDVGSPVAGTGSIITIPVSPSGPAHYFQVRAY
jgi:hypothetical protein